MKLLRLLFFSILAVFYSEVTVVAQDNTQILRFDEFADSLETSFGVKCYYSPAWYKGIRLQSDFTSGNIEDVLRASMPDTLKYLTIYEGEIVFTKNVEVDTALYSNLLNNANSSSSELVVYAKEKQQSDEHINEEYKMHVIGDPALAKKGSLITLRGFVKNAETNEPVIGAVIYERVTRKGSVTDEDGYYTIQLRGGEYTMEYQAMGMTNTLRQITLYSNGQLNVQLLEEYNALEEVVVEAHKESKVNSMDMGKLKIDSKLMKRIPLGLGEADVIKSALMLPGVQSVGEASAGFNVRGGSTDQNLVLLNDAPILNTAHFFGFFSAFNTHLIEDVTLYKSGIPMEYGGRVSSIMEVKMKEGNTEKVKLNGGLSPISANIAIDGPIIKDKLHFAIGGRSTFSDYLLQRLPDERLKASSASFYDLQGTFSYKLGEKDHILLSVYNSNDAFSYYTESSFSFQNQAATLAWKHTFGEKFMSKFSLITSTYGYSVDSKTNPEESSNLQYDLDHKIARLDFKYFPEKHVIKAGVEQVFYGLSPGVQSPIGNSSLIQNDSLQLEQAFRTSLYIGDQYNISQRFQLSFGARLNYYAAIGERWYNTYKEGFPREEMHVNGVVEFEEGEINESFLNPEFRVTGLYRLNTESSLKGGYSRLYQYIHMISNTASISPTDIWKLSDLYIKPQSSDQLSLGYYRSLKSSMYEFSSEIYYKKLHNIIDYKSGAQLIMNKALETDLINGEGKAYGLELMLSKSVGDLKGWVSYAYARSLHKIEGEFTSEIVNGGDYFPSNYDKPHDFKFVANYMVSRRFHVSSNFVYTTGRPITYPVAYIEYAGAPRVYYSERNAYRIPDYVRLDVAATLFGNLRKQKLNHSSWTLAVYNLLGRKNPYSIYFRTESGQIKGYKMSIFAQPIVTVTYNFKFLGNAQDD